MTLNTTRQPLAPPPVTDTGGDMGMVALVAMLTACSSEDVLLDEPNAKNEITFNVTTNRTSRAVQIFNFNNPPAYFRYSAWAHGGNPVANHSYAFQDLVVKKGNAWEIQDGPRYWPGHGETLDFFAWCCGSTTLDGGEHGTFAWNSETEYSQAPTLHYTVNSAASDQKDLLFATTSQSLNSSNSSSVPASQSVDLTFKHAMSQIAFTAKNADKKIHVEISEVSICNVYYQGYLNFPFKGADATWKTIARSNTSWTSVANLSHTDDQYEEQEIDGELVQVKTGSITTDYIDLKYNQVVNLTEGNDTQIMMLIPQMVNIDKNQSGYPTWNFPDCPYISLKCKIWNVNKPSDDGSKYFGWDSKTDNLIFGEASSYKEIRIPISLDWVMGKKYTYNIIFGNGNAGFTSDSKPAIVPMTYTVQTDNWSTADGYPKNVEEPGSSAQ